MGNLIFYLLKEGEQAMGTFNDKELILFLVTRKSEIDNKNIATKTRLFVARFHRPNEGSGGDMGVFTLKNIRLSQDVAYIEEDVWKGMNGSAVCIGIARTAIAPQQKINLHKDPIKRDLLNYMFNEKPPTELLLQSNYKTL